MRTRNLIIILILLTLYKPMYAQVQGQIIVDEEDSPLVITGWIGDQGSFEGTLRLTSLNDSVDSFIFLPSDLISESKDGTIGRQHINIVGDTNLKTNIPKNYQVTIIGVDIPGIYNGKIEILKEGDMRENALVVPIQVIAKIQPNLTPLPGLDRVQLKLVRTGQEGNNFLAEMFLHDSAFQDGYKLKFKNNIKTTVKIINSEIMLIGEHTGYQITGNEIALDKNLSIGAKEIGALQLNIDRPSIPPDHYTGDIYLTVEGMDEWLEVPVDLYMRTRPWYPFWILIFGIAIGRLVKYMQESGAPLVKGMRKVYNIEAKIGTIHEEDQKILAAMLERARKMAYKEDYEKLDSEISIIEDRIEILENLRKIQDENLKGKEQHPVSKQIMDIICKARMHIEKGEDEAAGELLKNINPLLEKLKSNLMGAGAPQDDADTEKQVKLAMNRALEAEAAAKRAAVILTKPISSPRIRNLKKILIFLTGQSDAIRAEISYWFIPPLLYMSLMLGLIIIGMGSFYVDKGLSFGANPLADYTGLFLWGLSSEVASKTLSNLGEFNKGGA